MIGHEEAITIQPGMQRRWHFAALILCLSLFAQSMVFADAGLDDYNVAVALYKAQRWQLAADGFRKFLRDYPQHERTPLAQLYLGLTLVNQSDYKAARESLRLFATDAPQNANLPQARYRIAECSYLLNDLAAARSEFELYLKSYPDDVFAERAWPYLGDVRLRQNDTALATEAFKIAVEKFPQGPLIDDARFGLAKSLEAQKQYPEAIKLYEQLAGGNGPRAAEAQFQVGSRRFDEAAYPQAAAAYQKLIERFPESPLAADARLNAGFALYRSGNLRGAEGLFELAQKDKGREITAGYWRALSQKGQGKPADAVVTLRSLSGNLEQHPLAEAIAFQTGMCERLAGDGSAAQTSLMAMVKNYPQSEFADDALHFATELAIEAGDLTAAESRLKLFRESYAQSGLRLYQELLAGRYQLALAARLATDDTTAAANAYQQAIKAFDRVLTESTLPRARSQARYYLAVTQQLQGDYPDSLKTIQPLVDQLSDDPKEEFADALVIQADSQLQLKQFAPAVAALDRYLDKYAAGRQRPRALSLLAIAHARQNDQQQADAALERLLSGFPQSPLIASTLVNLAELAESKQDWSTAIKWYERAMPLSKGTENAPFVLRGLGWSRFQQKDFSRAADDYAALERDYPNHRLVGEAVYYRAEALREAGQLSAAAEAYVAAFARWAPTTPAAPMAEQAVPLLYAYRSGLNLARVRTQLKQIPEADRAYAALLEKFPRPKGLDRLLDEWALVNYEAERFDEADAIFRRLLTETPESDLADNARLSLAESDLLAGKLEAANASFEELKGSPKADAAVRERAHYQMVALALERQKWADVARLASEFIARYPESPSVSYVDYSSVEAVLAGQKTTPEMLADVAARLSKLTQSVDPAASAWGPRLWVLLAEVQFRQKDYDAVAKTVADLKRRQPAGKLNYQAEEVLGRSLKNQALFPEARIVLQRVLDDPAAFRTETAAKSQLLIADCYFLQEKWPEAFVAYIKVYSSYAFPDWQAAALLQAAKCDEQQGQWKEAAAGYEKLLAEFPNSGHEVEAKKRLEFARQRISKP